MNIVPKWIKTGAVHDFVFIGKDIIATASGNHVLFFNLVTREENIEYFNSTSRGEGASCLAGHPVVPMFSTAERCYSPKIYVHTYPDIRKVAVCRLDKGPNSYLSCCFAGTEYLLSLTSFPNFQLILWLWRTGEKIASIDTMLTDEIQTIEASLMSANLIYQFSPTVGKLWTYEIYAYSKKITIIKNCVKSIEHKIVCVCWTNNGNLLLCDVYQNVYIVGSDGKKSQLILSGDTNIKVENQILVLPFHNGFVMVDSNSQLTCYNKSFLDNNSSEIWNAAWSITCTSDPLKMTLARHKEAILLYTKSGNIFELCLDDNKSELKEIYYGCKKFKFMCMLKPHEVHLVLIDSSNCLTILNIFNGRVSATFEIRAQDQVLSIAAHPNIPLLAVSTSSGKCICFMVSMQNFEILKTIHLQQHPLNNIKFSKNGSSFGVTSADLSNIFLLKTVIGEEMKVFFHLKLKKPVIDFLIFENQETLQLVVLVKTFPTAIVGDCIEIYSVYKWENSFCSDHKIYMHCYYQNLKYGLENVCDFLGSPYLSKHLHLFKIQNDYESIIFINALSSAHKLRKFDVNISRNFTVTSGFDGFVILRNSLNFSKTQCVFMVHHYQEKGTKHSVSSLCGKVIISLGRNGSLVCLKFCKSEKESEEEFPAYSTNIETLTWGCIHGTNEFLLDKNKTWLEHEEEKVIQKERNEMLSVKTIIIEDLKILKTEIKRLLDLNETKSVETQLSVSTFDLNSEKRKKKINNDLSKQEETKTFLQERISQKEKVIGYLMQTFWDSLEIHDCTLISFNCKTYINNFSLRRIDQCEKMDDFSIELFNTPLLSACIEVSEFKEDQLNVEPNSTTEILEKSNEYEDSLYLKYSNDIVFTGSTSFQWIKDDSPPNQLSKTVFDNNNYDFITTRENKLKIYFNKKFEEMRSLKNNVLQEMTDRLNRLSKCKSELKDVFGIISEDDKFSNIKWHSVETPENIIIIKEEEISPEFHINDCSSNEDEESPNDVEKMKKASNPNYEFAFREMKLQEMMDGLLEIRWEDEIRKSVMKPSCLLFKSPSKYDKKDIISIAVYKQKVNKLKVERQKYKTYLESEIKNINDQIKADIEDFDKKMEEFSLEKIKIKSAILQEFLLRMNERKRQLLKDYGNKKIFSIVNNDLVLLENENKTLTYEVTSIEPIVVELRSKYESLNKRDKVLEGKFRGEFAELKQPMVEHLLRQYKRRPRIGQITCTSLTYLAETNKCLIVGKKSAILPRDYLDFLRGMDALDVMPNSLPPQIDASHWQSLCKLRRNKVEMEIKLRIAALELAEAEQAFFYLQKLSSSVQSRVYFMRNNIEEETLKQSKLLKNPEIQVVLKAAQIEIFITGHSSNFENAGVVTCKQLIEVNSEIIMEGEKKIASMRALMKLKKSILFRNWKYQCMFKKLKHLKEHLTVLQNTKIGKEMQNFLVERLEDKIQYKDAASCDKMLKSVQKKFQRMLSKEEIDLLRVVAEIEYWRKMNAELITSVELFSLRKQEQSSKLEEDHLRKRNRVFRKNYLRSIMERTRLVEKVKESRNELLGLHTQLELLKLKTYPTLRCKNASYYRRSILKKCT